MAQFTRYTSADSGAPTLTGAAGSLIALFKACLVDGYGSKAAAGWTQPIATASNIGSFKQGTGAKAGFGFVLNDNAPNATPSYREAWATGYKTVAGVGSAVGSGSGQFPTAAQLLTTGHVVIRKSTTADSTVRPWVLYADARTLYFFARTGDNTTGGVLNFYDFAFGEFYSVEGSGYANNCFISGRNTENTAALNLTTGGLDRSMNPICTTAAAIAGAYFADNVGGSSGSQLLYPCGDLSKGQGLLTVNQGTAAVGLIPSPNGIDNSYYFSEVALMDAAWAVRGKLRGIYHTMHSLANSVDGTVITGSGAYAGKTFRIVSPGACNGALLLEESATVDTN